MDDFRSSERYRRLQKGLLDIFRRFSEFFVGGEVDLGGNRFIVEDFGLVLNPGVSLRGSFTCRVKAVADGGGVRELSSFNEVERAFRRHDVNEGSETESKKGERAFRTYMQLFFNVWKDQFKGEILDCLQGIEKAIKASITKTRRLLDTERSQEVRSSSDAHHGKNLQRQKKRLENFHEITEEALGNEVVDIMRHITCSGKVSERFERDYGVKLDSSSLRRGLKKNSPGRPPLVSEEEESQLLDLITHFAQHGTILTPDLVQKLLLEIVVNHKSRESLSNRSTFYAWYYRFGKKVCSNNPQFRQAGVRYDGLENLNFYNTDCIDYWYDMVIHQLLELGVAEKGTDNGEELIWKFPKRVVTIDETSTLQRSDHQHDKRTSAKVLLPASVLVDKQGRTLGAPVAAEHITLVVGYNFDGELLPPGWIFKGNGPGLTRRKAEMLDDLAKKYFSSDQLGSCNGTAYYRAPAVASENGSATQENFGVLLESIMKLVYRDASDESPDKRVVVFVDGHVSRFNVQHLRKLREAGIYLVLYPPNCTSKMQPPDVGFFASLKRKMKQKLDARRDSNHEQVTVAERIAMIGEAFKECNKRPAILESIEKAGLNPFRRQIHFDDPVLQRNDRMLTKKKIVFSGGFVAGLQNIAVPGQTFALDEQETTESHGASSAASSSSVFTSVSEQLAKAPESLDAISAFVKTRDRSELEGKARELIGRINEMVTSIDGKKNRMIDDRRAAQPDVNALLAAREQSFRDEIKECEENFDQEETRAIDSEEAALASEWKALEDDKKQLEEQLQKQFARSLEALNARRAKLIQRRVNVARSKEAALEQKRKNESS